jgi:diguanylate cyclase (GGDEF)-like protein
VGATIELGLVLLPLLLGVWLLTFLRTLAEARRLRSRALRMSLAAELGIPPRDLVGMSTSSLFALRDQVTFDELTGVLRRVAGVAAVEREIHRARRHHSPLAVCFVDVDGLKTTNDSLGHAEGDALLKTVAGLLTGSLRSSDTVFRYGGDEFVCVLPDCTGLDAEKNLKDLAVQGVRQKCSFSFGVAQLEPFDDVVSLLGRADGVLYERRREQAAPGPILRRMVELGTRPPIEQTSGAPRKTADTVLRG